ncbi:amidase [Paenibacillus sp. sgz302251]|uniref:amidase n=1 Tax=Paenibacillus sp. sgz302251 TaxID=3414493 RepID=UPI003C7B642F
MRKKWNAYVNDQLVVEPSCGGSLTGKSFAVKDVFAIAGYTSGAGNPDWLRTHDPASQHAAVIERLLGSGARLEGTTMTDELMYSINGENAHYGTPVNPNAPGRIPGGSSSGSAVAAAAGLVDFAIGTDTGGSVRVPAAYCGLYGIRPTHGAVHTGGLIPLAPSFDTVGWMTRDARTLLEVGRVLLRDRDTDRAGFSRLLFPQDLWALTDPLTNAALKRVLPALQFIAAKQEEIMLAPEGLQEWMNAFRTLQGLEIWQEHGEWITRVQPSFGPGIAERFAWAGTLKQEESGRVFAKREEVRAKMDALLEKNTLLVIPTVPAIAPPLHQTGEEVERRRVQALQLSCPAGLAGLPQVTVPVKGEEGCPLGLSFIAGRHQDMRLLEWVANIVDGMIKQMEEKGA